MRIIPKKIKVKNTVWKCYSMTDVVVALFVFAVIFIAITAGSWALAIVMGLIAVVMFMPTPDGIFYTCIFENIKFLFAKKRYTADAKNPKESVDTLIGLKEIKTNGLLVYSSGMYGRVIKIGQKNFGIEDVVQQNIDINYIANALKLLDLNQSADIIKIDRPVNLDGFAKDVFTRLSELRESEEEREVKDIKRGVLQERIDRIDQERTFYQALRSARGGCIFEVQFFSQFRRERGERHCRGGLARVGKAQRACIPRQQVRH